MADMKETSASAFCLEPLKIGFKARTELLRARI